MQGNPHGVPYHCERGYGVSGIRKISPHLYAPILCYDWRREVNASANPVWRNLGSFGSSYDATAPGGAANPTPLSGGYPGYAYVLASAQYQQIPAGAILSASRPFTVMAWVRCTAATAYPTLCCLQTAGAGGWKILFSSNDASYRAISFGEAGAGSFGRYRADTYPTANITNSTRHLAISYNGAGGTTIGNYTLCIDGVPWPLNASGVFGGLGNTSRIGKELAYPWSGDIYSLSLLACALPADVIRDLFERERHLYGV